MNEKEIEMFQAVEDGDVVKLKDLLDQGVDAKALGFNGNTALMEAARKRDVECVKALLPFSEVNKGNNLKFTALMWTAANGDEECLKLLLAAGADPLQKSEQKRTPLILASCSGNPKCLEILLPLSNALEQEIDGRTALMRAAEMGDEECVRLLLPVSNPKMTNNKGMTALMLAAGIGSEGCTRSLMPVSDIHMTDNSGNTALSHAALIGSLESAFQLFADRSWSKDEIQKARTNAIRKGNDSFISLLDSWALARKEKEEFSTIGDEVSSEPKTKRKL